MVTTFSLKVTGAGEGGGGGRANLLNPLWIRHILVRLGLIFHIRFNSDSNFIISNTCKQGFKVFKEVCCQQLADFNFLFISC